MAKGRMINQKICSNRRVNELSSDLSRLGFTWLIPFLDVEGRLEMARLLLEKGAHVNDQDKFSWTPLMIASRSGHADIVRVLLDAGADVNAKTGTGYTALMAAAKQGHAEIVKLLLARGADVHARDQLGWKSITLAARSGHEDIVKILERAEEK